MQIAKIHRNILNPKEAVEYLTPIKDYMPGDIETRWTNLFRLHEAKHRFYPKAGFKVEAEDSEANVVVVDVTQEADKEGYYYISPMYRDLAENGVLVNVFGSKSKVWTLPGKLPKECHIEFMDTFVINTMLAIIYHNLAFNHDMNTAARMT